MSYNNYKKNEKNFADIVLSQIEKILEISRSELKDKSRFQVQQNSANLILEEDTRKSYVQAVENLGYILMPYFDDEINKFYEQISYLFIDYNFEIIEKLKEEYQKFKENTESSEKEFCLKLKLQSAKRYFIELNKLLKRQDYLSSSIYGDVGSSSEVEDIEEEED